MRALQDALWRVSLTAYRALDKQPTDMKVEVVIGVPKPHVRTASVRSAVKGSGLYLLSATQEVDTEKVLAVLP